MDSEAYWQKRAEEREAYWHKKSREAIDRELARYFEKSAAVLKERLAILYARFAQDNALPYGEAVKLLKGEEYRVWRMSMEEYLDQIKESHDKGLLRELNTLAMRSRLTRLDKLYSETLQELDSLGRKVNGRMGSLLTDAYKDNYYRGLYEIAHAGEVVESVTSVSEKDLESVLRTRWSGKNYSERLWTNQRKLAATLKEAVFNGVHRGDSLPRLSQFITERLNVGKAQAERLIQTEMNFVQNCAALDSIKGAGMKWYEFHATLDSRTTQICRSLDGQVFKADEGAPSKNCPPMHPRCRSTICASFGPDHIKTGQRYARGEDGKGYHVPAQMRYEDWKAVFVDKSKTLEEFTRRKLARDGHEIIDQPTYQKLTKSFLNSGGVIIRGKEAEEHLKKQGAHASYIAGGMNVAFITDDATVSDVLEEMYHAKQDRADMFGKLGTDDLIPVKRELDAQKYLLSVVQKYKIPVGEVLETKKNLRYYEELLKSKQQEGKRK